jgi:hypothetical protein
MSCSKPLQQTTSHQTVEVFSALRFYNESSAGNSNPCGSTQVQLSVPAAGIHRVNPSSLEWIDGFFAQNEMCEEFVTAIERRKHPAPLISHTPFRLGTRCMHSSVDLLAHSGESIMAACGIVEFLVDTALASPVISCPSCNSAASRISTPLALGDLLLRDFDAQQVIITASSDDERFSRWVASMGFSTLHDSSHKVPTVVLDSGACSASFIARMSGVLRSVWTVPRLTITCRSGSEARVYAPQGWCSTCASLIAVPEKSALTKLLGTGQAPSELSAAAHKLERSLMLGAHLRIEDILASPLHSLRTSDITILQELSTLLTALELGDYPLSTPVCALALEDLAIFSIAVSLHRSRYTPSTIVVDLPSGILHRKHAALRAVATLSDYENHSFLLLGDPCTATTEQRGDSSAKAGTAREASRVPAREPTCTNGLPESSSVETWIPLFPTRTGLSRSVVDELGLVQGIAQLYAASIDARCFGLTTRDFSFTAARSHPYLCRGCKGLGIALLQTTPLPRPRAKPCVLCHGKRFKEPVASTLFRGVSYATLLNRPISLAIDTLRVLPRTRDLLECLQLLALEHLPLGMPTALLSSSELRRLLVLKAILAARPGQTRTIIIQAPHFGFTQAHRDGIEALQRLPFLADRCRWVEDY